MKNTNVLLGVLAVIVIIVGALFVYGPFRDLNKQKGPAEPTLQIALGSFVDARLYELSKGALSDVSFVREGSIVSRSRRHELASAISVLMSPNELGGALFLETPEGGRLLSEASSVKDTPMLSMDGTLVAYAELDVPFGTTLSSEDISLWRVKVLAIETGEITDLGLGYAPYFISGTPSVVLYSSPEGIVAVNLETDERAVFPSEVKNTTQAAHVSPDGGHLAVYNNLTKRYSIFAIVSPGTLEVSAVGEIPAALGPVALSNQYLFGINRDEGTNIFTLRRYTLETIVQLVEEGELIHTFAEGQLPYQLIP